MPRLLFLGDVVGRPGRQALADRLPALRAELQLDLVVANAENAASGAGINAQIAQEILRSGVDAITLGDHTWDQKGFEHEISHLDRVCRPANLPSNCPGRTHLIIERGGFRLGVVTILGCHGHVKLRADDAFAAASNWADKLRNSTDAILLEIHGDATSEKVAMGWFLDGRVGAVVGTHTHVPTADATILPRGTAYITDVGMTGPYHGVLGRDTQSVIGRFVDGMPRKFPVAEGDVRLCGLVVDFENRGGRAIRVERLEVRLGG